MESKQSKLSCHAKLHALSHLTANLSGLGRHCRLLGTGLLRLDRSASCPWGDGDKQNELTKLEFCTAWLEKKLAGLGHNLQTVL